MRPPSPTATTSVLASAAIGAAILQANSRLDVLNARGTVALETPMVLVLAGYCVAVLVSDQIWRSKWFQYAIAPVSALISIGAFLLGTARFD